MHRYSRMHLSPEVVRRRLDTIDLEEKGRIAEGISLIGVIDHRRDYLEAGYPCMRDYCMGRLHMSKDKAYRRIQVAKVALRFPDIYEYLADGRLSVTTASVLAPHLEPDTAAELLAAAAFRSRTAIERMLAERFRQRALVSEVSAGEPPVESCSTSLAPVQVSSLADLCSPPAHSPVSPQHPAPQVTHPRRGRVSPCVTGGHEVRLSITDEEHDDLSAVLALLGHAEPSGDPALAYARGMKLLRAHLEKRRLGVKPGAAVLAGRGRGIPKPLLRLIWERDGGRCAFEGTDGHRCGETRQLEVDHIIPVALGGKTTPENLRLLCRAHNQYEAERIFGKEHVQRRRELAKRERTRDRVAAEASAGRAKARATVRDEAQQARYDDIYAGLKGLGATAAEAKQGAEMADAMPDATTAECLKAALTELARPAKLRGERRARCTA